MTYQQSNVKYHEHVEVVEGHGPYKYSVSQYSGVYSATELRGVNGLWNALADNTTLHGYPNFNHSRGKSVDWRKTQCDGLKPKS